jgi:CRISPR/Cas system-associated protein Cas10 (large subunit of type III CRISPR-Cas system)
LYGASVQGIQEFIFATNKLQEIVGASEIVKKIEEEFLKVSKYTPEDERILLRAAGNIKAIFDNKEECSELVETFSKNIQLMAYGITLSQVLLPIDSVYPSKKDFRDLDNALKEQRNKPSLPLDMSLNIMKLNPATAKPVTNEEKKGKDTILYDKASWQKKEAFPKEERFKELSDLSNAKNKIAIIHADGNGLGVLVPQLGEKLSLFSVALDKATRKAFEDAKTENMKIREVVLGGDDLTMICDANEALGFTKRYLDNFEKNTKEIKELEGLTDKLTACAGIAYCNEKYPFHYAVSLAEALCKEAKDTSKRKASCLMFHNIQSSNFQTWTKLIEDELTIKNDKETIYCDFGPYYINKEDEILVDDFLNTVGAYKCDGSPISKLRSWLSELSKSHQYAENMLKRINDMVKKSNNWNCEIMEKNLKNFKKELSNETLIVKKDEKNKTPIYDILQILSATEAQ